MAVVGLPFINHWLATRKLKHALKFRQFLYAYLSVCLFSCPHTLRSQLAASTAILPTGLTTVRNTVPF